jgi:hypothetical protein
MGCITVEKMVYRNILYVHDVHVLYSYVAHLKNILYNCGKKMCVIVV